MRNEIHHVSGKRFTYLMAHNATRSTRRDEEQRFFDLCKAFRNLESKRVYVQDIPWPESGCATFTG